MPTRSSCTGPSVRLNVWHPGADAAAVVWEFTLRDTSDVSVVVRLWAELADAEFDPSPEATGTVACVTIVRAAPDAESARLRVNMPTAATSPVVVCANLLIENEPVTCGTEAASRAVVIDVVSAGVVADSAGVAVCDSEGVAVVDVVVVVDADVVGWFDAASVDVVGSTDLVGTFGVASVPVTGMISLPPVA